MDQILESDFHYRGPRGYSNYELAVQNGYKGTEAEWLEEQKQGAFKNYKADFDGEYSKQVTSFNEHVEDKTDEALDILDKEIAKVTNGQVELDPNAEMIQARSGFDTLGKTLKQKIYHFSNVEEMKNCINLVEGDVVQTLGYYSENDGGGATYNIRAKTDDDVEDGGSIHFIENSLVAELIVENGEVNVKQFGAKGDGENDDTIFIQNAINCEKVSKIIIDKIYFVTSLLLKSNISLIGKDKENCGIYRIRTFTTDNIDNYNRTSSILTTYNKNPDIKFENLNISNLTIDGKVNELNITDGDKLTKITAHNIYFRRTFNINIVNCNIKNAILSGLAFSGSDDIRVENCNIFANGISTMDEYGLSRNGISTNGRWYDDITHTNVIYECKNVVYKNNNIYDNEQEGIMFAFVNKILIENNNIYGNLDRAIEGDTSSQGGNYMNILILNNNIYSNNRLAMSFGNRPRIMNLIVKNNIIHDIETGYILNIDQAEEGTNTVIFNNNILSDCGNVDTTNVNTLYIEAKEIEINDNFIKNCYGKKYFTKIENITINNNNCINDNEAYLSCFAIVAPQYTLNANNNFAYNYTNNMFNIINNSNDSCIKINITNNTIINLLNFIVSSAKIEHAYISNNFAEDNREEIKFGNFFSISNTIRNLVFNNNASNNAKYGMISNRNYINNFYCNANDALTTTHFNKNFTKPTKTDDKTVQKGDIIFSSNIVAGQPIGWVFTGNEWKGFGVIQG